MQNWRGFLLLLLMSIAGLFAAAQGTVRGYVYEKSTGEPVIFVNVVLDGTSYGSTSDENGFYNITGVKPGTYRLRSTGIGYDTVMMDIEIAGGEIINQQLLLSQRGVQLKGVTLEADKIAEKTKVQISTVKATSKDIKRIPTVGGEADLAQYLQILPGIITTGDQGGQMYIRGGAPVQTKILLDGMNIYNAFHSIGLFSVYETETIRNVDVLTGGFNAEYGGRISAVVDVDTRDGNKSKFSGLISANPFVAKALVEGPIKKLTDEGSSVSYLFTVKNSYLDQTSRNIYTYAGENPAGTGKVLPYNFTDAYGKVAINTANGSKFTFSGFNFNDQVDFSPITQFNWNTYGLGTKATIVPGQSNAIINGLFNYSSYRISMQEGDEPERFSSVSGFTLGMNFTYFLPNDAEFKYGVDINGFRTEFEFYNSLGIQLDQNQNTTEIGGFFVYKKLTDRWVIEPSFRIQYYASLNNFSPEPRLGLKYNLSETVRLKFAGGFYSQNLISTKSDRDVVNLFTGFLSGPEERLRDIDGDFAHHKLQKAWHAITGVEWDISDFLELNVEPYVKSFTQLINLNRNKVFRSDPNYMIETGKAYGLDFLLKYETRKVYLWATYSLGKVTRDDGDQVYPPHFDRRHNVNLVGSYSFGDNLEWEVSARWNLGSGFPFTKTQGFYEEVSFLDGVNTDLLSQNGNLGIIYDEKLNTGRLPYYHRLDIAAKKTFTFSPTSSLVAIASLSNVYDRNNIFYFDRVKYERVNQLPILPSIGVTFNF